MINSSFLLKCWTIKASVDYTQRVNKCPVWPETSIVTRANKIFFDIPHAGNMATLQKIPTTCTYTVVGALLWYQGNI